MGRAITSMMVATHELCAVGSCYQADAHCTQPVPWLPTANGAELFHWEGGCL